MGVMANDRNADISVNARDDHTIFIVVAAVAFVCGGEGGGRGGGCGGGGGAAAAAAAAAAYDDHRDFDLKSRPRGLRASPQVAFPAPRRIEPESFLPLKRGYDDTHRTSLDSGDSNNFSYIPSVEIQEAPDVKGNFQHNCYLEDLIFSSKPNEDCNVSSAYEELCSVEMNAQSLASSHKVGNLEHDDGLFKVDYSQSTGVDRFPSQGVIPEAAASRLSQPEGIYLDKKGDCSPRSALFAYDSSAARYDHAECCAPLVDHRDQIDLSESLMRHGPYKPTGSADACGRFYGLTPAPCKDQQSLGLSPAHLLDGGTWVEAGGRGPDLSFPQLETSQGVPAPDQGAALEQMKERLWQGEERRAGWDISSSYPSWAEYSSFSQSLNSYVVLSRSSPCLSA
eukprot:748158-Hanusia_phi.AAC.4